MAGQASQDVRVGAPELPDELHWVNIQPALRLSRLRGRVILLHFWCHTSINAQHSLVDLEQLQRKYSETLCAISIHSPRFPAERSLASVTHAVERAAVEHPVASDPDWLAWRRFGITAWPTVVVIDARGHIVRSLVGEGQRTALEATVQELQKDVPENQLLPELPEVHRARPLAGQTLRFPTRVVAGAATLYIADTGHHRILETTHEGRILRQFGSGNPDFCDGSAEDASFRSPQGMAVIGDQLYIADRGNHAIRCVHLLSGDVTTAAGSGKQGLSVVDDAEVPQDVALDAPCDLAAAGDRLFVAMAGANQIWALDLVRQRVGRMLGTGANDTYDGGLDSAAFARPSALAVHGPLMYVAEGDGSAIRSVRLHDRQVRTLVGGGPWEPGDVDGGSDKARLQAPESIALDPGGAILWIADTLNSKIKALSLRGGELRTLALPYRFDEPAGISVAAHALWVANTNAHEVVRIDTASGLIRRVPIGD